MRIGRLVVCAVLAALLITTTREAGATLSGARAAGLEGSDMLPEAAATATPLPNEARLYGIHVYLPVIIKSAPAPAPTPTLAPAGWRVLLQDNLDQTFPGQSWDDFNGWGTPDYFWGQRNCRAASGRYSAWAIGGGLRGAQEPCTANYADWSDSWMVHGPIDLAGATAAEMRYTMWLNTERGFDTLCSLASLDRVHYYGRCAGGNTMRWVDRTLDLSNVPQLGNLLGQRQVWVGFAFTSDGNINLPEGAYIDDVLIRICRSLYCPLAPAEGPSATAAWDDTPRMLIAPPDPAGSGGEERR